MKYKFSRQIAEKNQMSRLIKSVQWQPNCSMWSKGRTDGQKWRG